MDLGSTGATHLLVQPIYCCQILVSTDPTFKNKEFVNLPGKISLHSEIQSLFFRLCSELLTLNVIFFFIYYLILSLHSPLQSQRFHQYKVLHAKDQMTGHPNTMTRSKNIDSSHTHTPSHTHTLTPTPGSYLHLNLLPSQTFTTKLKWMNFAM